MNNTIIRHRASWFLVLVLPVFLAAGCYPKPSVPIDTLRYAASGADHQHLFVFLPGNGDSLSTYDKNGLVRAVRDRGLPVDMIAVNAHLGYYMDGSVFTRLKQDVVGPAKARGYKTIWLIGNSLGGYGSLSYARQYPEDVSGVVLLGPFLGEKKTAREIRKAGGLRKWDPGEIPQNGKDGWEKQLWKWLKDSQEQKDFWNWIRNCEDRNRACPPRIYLGFGKRDRFSYGQKLMAESLPPENVFEIDGGHNWDTWIELWNMILDEISSRTSRMRAEASRK